jgi:SprT-like family
LIRLPSEKLYREVDYNPFVQRSCRRDRDLEVLFGSLNLEFFEGRLQKYEVYLCTKSKNFGHYVSGFCDANHRKIFLRGNLSKKAVVQSLAHEMVHAKLARIKNEAHGKLFLKELRKIRKLGAPLSPYDIDMASGYEPPPLSKRNLKNAIRQALYEEKLPNRAIPKYLEREFSEPIERIGQKYDIRKIIEEI